MLKFLLEKEFKLFFRNLFLPLLVVFLPFIAMAVFPLVSNLDIKNINIAVVDHDKSSYSSQLINKVLTSSYFTLTDIFDNYAQALESIEDDRTDMILEIPPYFERNLNKNGNGQLFIALNAVDGAKGGLGSYYITGIITDYNKNIQADLIQASTRLQVPNIDIRPVHRFNPTLNYIYFMIPAMIVMMMALIVGFLPALNIVGEKEDGTIEQMNVTPVRKSTFILSKLIPYWVIGCFVVLMCVAVAWLLFNFVPKGSILIIFLFSFIFIITFSGLGLVVSNYASTIQQAMFIMFFFITVFIFLSGLFTPYDNMPQWAQAIGTISPLNYIVQVQRMVYLKGATFSDLIPHLIALCLLALLFNGWAILSYRKIKN